MSAPRTALAISVLAIGMVVSSAAARPAAIAPTGGCVAGATPALISGR